MTAKLFSGVGKELFARTSTVCGSSKDEHDYSYNALSIYRRLYFSEILGETTPEQVHKRVAEYVAKYEGDSVSETYVQEYRRLMDSNIFRPNSPTLMNAGVTSGDPILSACFVGGLEDDLRSILDFDREAAIIFSYGAGIGINWGVLRERDAALSTGGKSSGPISFMKKLNATAECVRSGGRTRRAAIMSMCFIDHPDIEDFIDCKRLNRELSSMNLSVAVTSEFMRAVKEDADWNFRSVKSGSIVKTVKAKSLYMKMCENAWLSGDPGIVFIDRVNEDNTIPELGMIVSTNPCGEQPLHPHGVCCLGSINVAKYADIGFEDQFRDDVYTAVRFLDSIVDVSGYPTPDYSYVAKHGRNIGLGIMGLADLFLLKGVRYGDSESLKIASEISRKLCEYSIDASLRLATEKGTCPACEDFRNRDAIARFMTVRSMPKDFLERLDDSGIRNMQWTTAAPTGSTSISCDCSPGIEPFFSIVYDKKLTDCDETLRIVSHSFESLHIKEPWYTTAVSAISHNNGSCAGLERELPLSAIYPAVCSHEVGIEERLQMQAALQEYISSAISSTLNLRKSASVDDIMHIYMRAWEMHLKGITIYRDGSNSEQPITFGSVEAGEILQVEKSKERPIILSGKTHKVTTNHGNVYLTVNCNDDGRVVEVFTNGGKCGSVDASNLEALARVISIALQEGADLERIASTLCGINGGEGIWTLLDSNDTKASLVSSIPDAVGKVLLRFYSKSRVSPDSIGNVCKECGGTVIHSEGCMTCLSCGWSRCS